MGTPITDLLVGKEITIQELKGKILAVDTYNLLYQFLSSIRQPNGTPLMDSKGRTTSHLIGLFNRITKLMLEDIKFVFVFDGETPELKKKERERRKKLKLEAQDLYEEAKQREDTREMKKYASRTSKLDEEMIKEAKKLITALGMPIIDAASEGEAQAAFMVQNKDCYAVVSQDTDSLIFGAPLVVKNLTISGKRKTINKLTYKNISPELISLFDNLNNLGVTQEQLIVIAMLAGTDYNIGGVKGIGPKKALALVKNNKEDYEATFKEAKWDENFDIEWQEIFYLIKKIPVKKDYELEWKNPDSEAIIKLLVDEHDFNRERVEKTIEKLFKGKPKKEQKGLGEFF
ncbi:MAG: flap endonuclease-1 [Nanoarchaeota archaeon]|nr:flap endonuclease-1 [Nanoarchaeota archaeon]MBU1269194.1 flap endonuclease-1 [Nanoarchaeota archaeon]MBU1605046.1 flap endonuclease-1 [Nanoarchaeota archaeon]MBU2442883.1 flap endonuclease-1 [Nanoarchaeota archaeon]